MLHTPEFNQNGNIISTNLVKSSRDKWNEKRLLQVSLGAVDKLIKEEPGILSLKDVKIMKLLINKVGIVRKTVPQLRYIRSVKNPDYRAIIAVSGIGKFYISEEDVKFRTSFGYLASILLMDVLAVLPVNAQVSNSTIVRPTLSVNGDQGKYLYPGYLQVDDVVEPKNHDEFDASERFMILPEAKNNSDVLSSMSTEITDIAVGMVIKTPTHKITRTVTLLGTGYENLEHLSVFKLSEL